MSGGKLLLIIPLLLIGLSFTSSTYAWQRANHLERSGERVPGVQEEIVIQAEKAGINPQKALNIAACESNFLPNAKNPNSSAKGVYQFLSKTWKNYCEGVVYDYKANIKCFMRWYKVYPSWWECG